jgi:hypothetical protein
MGWKIIFNTELQTYAALAIIYTLKAQIEVKMMDEGRGMAAVSVRIPPETKALWQSLADREGRSLTNYLVMLLKREAGMYSDSLNRLDGKLDYLMKVMSTYEEEVCDG